MILKASVFRPNLNLRDVDLNLGLRLGLNLGLRLGICPRHRDVLQLGGLTYQSLLQLPPGPPLIRALLASPAQVPWPLAAVAGLGNLLGQLHRVEDVGGDVLALFSLVDVVLADAAVLLHLQAVEVAEVRLQDYLVVDDPAVAGGEQALALDWATIAGLRDDFEAKSAISAQDAIDGMLVWFRLGRLSPVADQDS